MGKTRCGTTGVLALAVLLAAGFLSAQDEATRTVTVKVAADRNIENISEWKIAAVRLLNGCFHTFQECFGIRLAVENIVTWKPQKSRGTFIEMLGDLKKSVAPGKCDIVLGVVIPESIDSISLGIASYPSGYVLVKNMASREAMVYALLHEFCHIFGAIELREKGTLMGIESPGFGIDHFTLQVVRLHRRRLFNSSTFPLPKGDLGEAVAIYGKRAELGLEEPEVHLFLTLFQIELNDLDAAARACAEAVHEDPGFSGLHILLGNISLKKGAADQAIDEYRKALDVLPHEPGLYFNLGLAYAQKGVLAEALAYFERALEIYPGYAQSRLALERIRRASPLNARLDLGLEPEASTALNIK